MTHVPGNATDSASRPDESTTHPDHDDFGGLHRDTMAGIDRKLARRRALPILGGIGLTGLIAACSSTGGDSAGSGPSSTTATSSTTTTSASAGTVATAGAAIPQETAGPYPADGSNGPNVLSDGAVVRQDITTSFDGLDGTAAGIPAEFQLSVVDASTGDPMPGAAVYLWHCTADGKYSIYEIADQNYLRGVQAADDAGRVAFNSIFPGCYRGRWPHVHFEIYESVDEANRGSNAIRTSQLALPQADCEVAYQQSEYGNSSSNLGSLSLSRDNVFADGWTDQLATVSGSPEAGYTVSLLVRV